MTSMVAFDATGTVAPLDEYVRLGILKQLADFLCFLATTRRYITVEVAGVGRGLILLGLVSISILHVTRPFNSY